MPDILIGKDHTPLFGVLPRSRYLKFGGTEHVAVLARTGTGKTRNFCIPNAFAWPDSLIVFDIKGEIYAATAGSRAYRRGHAVYCFNPTAPDLRTHCWNPLDVVERGSPRRFDQIMRQAYLLIPDPKEGTRSNAYFWKQSARMALYSVTLMLAEMLEEPLTYSNVLSKFIRGDGAQWLVDSIAQRRMSGRPFSQDVINGVSDYIGLRDRLHEDIRKSVSTELQAFQNPNLVAATNHSDFDLRRLRREPMSIYITVNPGDLPRVEHLLRLFFSTVINLNVDVTAAQDKTVKYSVLMLLDEFARLGAMTDMTRAAQFVRGYGIRLAYVIQDKPQLEDLYGTAGMRDIFDNLGAEFVFGISDIKTAKEYEQRLGDWTISYNTRNQRRFLPTWNWQQQTVSGHQGPRPLMLDQEIVGMSPEVQLIIRTGMRPAKTARIVWDQDPKLASLVAAAPPAPEIEVCIADDDHSVVLSSGSSPNQSHGSRPGGTRPANQPPVFP